MDQCEVLSQSLWEETVAFIRANWAAVDRIAKALMERDSLSAEEVTALYNEAQKTE